MWKLNKNPILENVNLLKGISIRPQVKSQIEIEDGDGDGDGEWGQGLLLYWFLLTLKVTNRLICT